jgi:septum formation topological specificity factor MinE
METISRHISIDTEGVKIDFHHEHSPTAMVINAPVRGRGGVDAMKHHTPAS